MGKREGLPVTGNLTQKQEAFAHAYLANKGNASEAYRKAYSAKNMSAQAIWVEASRLLQHPTVALRVAEARQTITEKSEEKLVITVEKLTAMTMDAYRLAMHDGVKAPSAAVKASEFLGKLHGLVVERREVTNKSAPDDLDDDELSNIARSGGNGTAQKKESPARPN